MIETYFYYFIIIYLQFRLEYYFDQSHKLPTKSELIKEKVLEIVFSQRAQNE